MPKRQVRLTDADNAEIEAALTELRRQLRVPTGFPEEVVDEAERAARSHRRPRADETEVPFVTIDPPTSMDLDQAMHLERDGKGYRVRYAIADVAAFVKAGGELDAEAHRRGETLYAPDGNSRLYPPVLSEGAASLSFMACTSDWPPARILASAFFAASAAASFTFEGRW